MSRASAGLLLAAGVLALSPAGALVETDQGGHWPADWPRELEPLRERAPTIGVATGFQETIYQIPLRTPEEFQRVWPALLGVKSKGGTLTLRLLSDKSPAPVGATSDTPCVRIYAPCAATVGKALHTGPPWPDSARLPNGELPEWVTDRRVEGRLMWVPVTAARPAGDLFRARVDLELVVDGAIINLNRTYLPADTPIVDQRRFADAGAEPPEAP
jgi:hypothetical protein